MSLLEELPSVVTENIEELRPCQEKAIEEGLLDGENLLVSAPTASGKTLVAESAAINNIEEGKCVYIVPLKALALEKYQDFKEKYSDLKISVSIGDLDSSDPWLSSSDIIITTSEKMESLVRHGAKWINNIKTVVVDEIHLLNDSKRGPTLEVLITLLQQLLPKSQLIALSATIGNPKELSEWLGANLVEDDWRPVRLYQGVYNDEEVDFFEDRNSIKVTQKTEPAVDLALDTIKRNKQALIFCPTKRSAEATAERIAKLRPAKSELKGMKDKALKALSSPTKQCRRLGRCLHTGIAFHHAGLHPSQKSLVEDSFREGKIKIICCTPTLAMGLDVDAFRTVMKSLKRFTPRWGYTWIPVLEYHQQAGRAGRP